MSSQRDVTLLLQRMGAGGKDAVDEVFPLIFDELRSLADRRLRKENAAHTLQPTALVNEAYLRLVDQNAAFESRMHFFKVAAMMMRRVLIDHARGKKRDKRAPDRERVELTESVAVDPETDVDLIALDEALERLEEMDERKVRIVELRYFAGRTIEETAHILQVSEATVSRDWDVARLWLLRELRDE